MNYTVETQYLKIWKEDNILHCVFADKLNVNLEIAMHCVRERIAFSQGQSYPYLIDMTGVLSMTKEVRGYMAIEGAKYIKAGALLTHSALSKMLGNLFLSINKPAIPTKLFTDVQAAKDWLQQYI